MTQVDNKRVAKNAIALTFRMVLVTIVGLFTSRIVLQALGVDDYGIYGVIGGVVGMVSFLNTSMAGATSRFITFELGRGNEDKLQKIFSTSLIIHIIIAVVVALLAETIGLWFVNNKMNFPPGRMVAVNVLYQFTIVSMMVNFTQVPYSAAIIAHEKMSIYAYFEIINVTLKLLIVYLLLIVAIDRLILYAALMLAVSVISALIYRFYCIRHFKESHFSWSWDKSIMREMLAFSGYDLYGNMCAVMKSQGQPIILNLFYGVIANAASSVASTMTNAISGLTGGVFQAFRPQIIKTYASGQIDLFETMLRRSTLFSLISYSGIGIPFYVCAEEILYLWLGEVPLYAVDFVRLIIIASIFSMLININNTIMHATGNIKRISFVNGTFYLLCPIVSYFVLKYLMLNVLVVYVVNVVFLCLICGFGWTFISKQVPEICLRKYILIVIKCFMIISFVGLISIMNKSMLANICVNFSSVIQALLVGLLSLIMIIILSISLLFNKEERSFLLSKIKNREWS